MRTRGSGASTPPRCRDDITDRSDYEIRFIERNVMAAALGHDLLADTRQRDQSRLILVVLLFALLTGRQIHELSIVRHHPDARQIRLPVGRLGRGSGEVGLAVSGARNPRSRIIQPLRANRSRGKRGDEENRSHSV